MTHLHAHAHYIYIVNAKYQKSSVKALVQVDFPIYAQAKSLFKVKKYKKTSGATSNVGYQTNVVLESASSSALEIFAYNLFIYLFCVQFIYLFILCCNRVLYTGIW